MDKQALMEHINRAIVLLGTMKIRVDEIGTIGVVTSEAIQHLGECSKLINEEEKNEQEDCNEPR